MSSSINTLTLDLRKPFANLRAPDSRIAKVNLLNAQDEGLGNLVVTVAEREHRLDAFCPRGNWDESQNCYGAELSYIEPSKDEVLVLLGDTYVSVVNDASEVCPVLQLFRSGDDDRAFYQPFKRLEDADRIVVLYESGIFCLSHEGLVCWHTRLRYDDALTESSGDEVTFSNEHVNNGKPWKVSLADGSIAF